MSAIFTNSMCECLFQSHNTLYSRTIIPVQILILASFLMCTIDSTLLHCCQKIVTSSIKMFYSILHTNDMNECPLKHIQSLLPFPTFTVGGLLIERKTNRKSC